MNWIVQRGVERIPDDVSFELASLVEPLNTVHKAISQANPRPGDLCVVMGQGPIGLIFTMLLQRTGARVVATDKMPSRMELGRLCGALEVWNPAEEPDLALRIRNLTDGRGADLVVVAVSAPGIVDEAIRLSRPGAGILLFSQTSAKERVDVSGADICVGERVVFGSYSASVDLQKESARLVFSGELPLDRLISHRLPLNEIGAGFNLARQPDERALKIIVQPQRWSR
jgi:L-iditol 2-dehydrogenase